MSGRIPPQYRTASAIGFIRPWRLPLQVQAERLLLAERREPHFIAIPEAQHESVGD